MHDVGVHEDQALECAVPVRQIGLLGVAAQREPVVPVGLPVDIQTPGITRLGVQRRRLAESMGEPAVELHPVGVGATILAIGVVDLAVEQRRAQPLIVADVADDLVVDREREAFEAGELECLELDAERRIARVDLGCRGERPANAPVPRPREVGIHGQGPLGRARDLVVEVDHRQSRPVVLAAVQPLIEDIGPGVEPLLAAGREPSERDARARAIRVLQLSLQLELTRPVHGAPPALALVAVVALDRPRRRVGAGPVVTALPAVLHELRQDRPGDRAVGVQLVHDRVHATDDEQRHRIRIPRGQLVDVNQAAADVLRRGVRELPLDDRGAEPPQIVDVRHRAAERRLQPVVADADAVAERLVRLGRERARQFFATRLRRVRHDAGLCVGELDAERPGGHRRFFQRVSADADALRAGVGGANRRAVDVDVRLARPTATDGNARGRSRLDHTRLEHEHLARVVDRQLGDEVTGDRRARRHLVARHDRVRRRLDSDGPDRDGRRRELDVHRQRKAALHAHTRHFSGRVADELGPQGVAADRNVVDEVVPLVVRQRAERRADDGDLSARDRSAFFVRHRALDLPRDLLCGER